MSDPTEPPFDVEAWRAGFDRMAALISEGICPRHQSPLEPRHHESPARRMWGDSTEIKGAKYPRTGGWWIEAGPVGWCPACGSGYRLRKAGPDHEWLTTPDNPYVIDFC